MNQVENSTIVSKAFGKQSKIFDEIYDSNIIVGYMRAIIRKSVLSKIKPGEHLLELNAGTGTDAVFFGSKGINVSASDISSQMVEKANQKIKERGLQETVTFGQMSFEELGSKSGQYDHVYSNFGGLNCTENITQVVSDILEKLKSGKSATLVILPPFTLWEKLYYLVGNPKIAGRRKRKGPSMAHLEGEWFQCWYYNPSDIIIPIRAQLKTYSVQGMCIFVPPSFKSDFPEKYPMLFRVLVQMDRVASRIPLLNQIGDYYILSLTKK